MASYYYEHRRYTILNLINHLGPVSRKRLVELTDYRPATIGEICSSLLEEGMIIEAGQLTTGLGRRRTLLEIDREHICSLALSFSSAKVKLICARVSGEVIDQRSLAFDSEMQLLVDNIINCFREMIAAHSDCRITGIGICEPIYDQGYSSIGGSGYDQFAGWIRTELKQRLEVVFPYNVRCFNAVTLPALVERRYGEMKDCRNFICVEISNGIGCSICCNGHIIPGETGSVGELGHTVIDYERAQLADSFCYCGKSGCVEHDAAFPAIAQELTKFLSEGVYSELNKYYDGTRPLRAEDIRKALDGNDHLCMRIVGRAARRIGVAIANVVNILNPQAVVLYGFMTELGDFFLNELKASLFENVYIMSRDIDIRVSPMLGERLALGAAAEMFMQDIHAVDYSWIYKLDASGEKSEEAGDDE